MRFVIVALIGLLMSLTSRAACFEEHVREAIELNHARTPLYARASGGASQDISRSLIAMEKRMLFFSTFLNYDFWAKNYEARGIGITCDSYVSMSLTPKFLARDPKGAIPASQQFDARDVLDVSALWDSYSDGFDAFVPEAIRQIRLLQKQPRLNCLTAHFLESAVRIAKLAPRHEREARAAGMGSPTWIHRQMVWGHLLYLQTAMSIDASARPLQAKGLPIICRDLPAIPF